MRAKAILSLDRDNLLYRKLELVLYGIVLVVSVGIGVVTERLDFRLQIQTLAAEIARTNQAFAYRIEAEISQLVALANGMAAAVALKPNLEQSEFSKAAARLGTNDEIVLNISLATDGVVQRVFPVDRNFVLIGKDLSALPNQGEGVELARQTGKHVFLGPLDLIQGGRGFILRLAFSQTAGDSSPSGRRQMISIVVDSGQFFGNILREISVREIDTQVLSIKDGTIIFGKASVLERPIIDTLTTPSDIWQAVSAPASGWPVRSSSAATIAGLTLVRILVVCAVLRIIFEMLRKQKLAEERLSVAVEVLDDGFALFDSRDRLILRNRRFQEIYCMTGDFLTLGATFEEIIRGGVKRGQYADVTGPEEWIARNLRSHRLGRSTVEQKLANGRWVRVVERKTKDGSTVGLRVKERLKNLPLSA